MQPAYPATKFQSFEEISAPALIGARVKKLRELMEEQNLDAYLVPLADAHRGESLPNSEKRLCYISGFSGSAGMALIARQQAILFVDGRYTVQAPLQTDTKIFQVLQIPTNKPGDWINKNLGKNARIGFDPWLHTIGEIRTLNKQLENHATLVPGKNLIEKIWSERPQPPVTQIEILNIERAGILASEKIHAIQKQLKKQNSDALVLNIPECICWLFNIRGRDVPNTPVALSFAIIHQNKVPELFINSNKLNQKHSMELSEFLSLHAPDHFEKTLLKLAKSQSSIWLDPATCPQFLFSLLKENGAKLLEKPDPIMQAKAIKNSNELSGMKKAHLLDAIAMTKFLCWFDKNAPDGKLDEIEITSRLEAFRAHEPSMVDISFDTIAGAGPNGAIVHYRVTKNTNRKLNFGELMLVDSGGQYLSGTTDITRTLFTGSASAQQKQHFTLVLKGMIAISALNFPSGTTGGQIDILARHALWQAGLNYSHGTGHGVGAFLSVHEGPAGIAPRYHLPLQAGMILSNEPGYYLQGQYGIRIENLIHVINSPVADDFLAFETLTLAPIEIRLLDLKLLSQSEIDWLNKYHKRVRDEISPLIGEREKNWLQQATAKI